MVFLKESISVFIGEMWIDGKITGTDASMHVRDFRDYNLDSGIYAIIKYRLINGLLCILET